MLFRTSHPDEGNLVAWFIENFGQEDVSVLTEWVWNKERDANKYIIALNYILMETQKHGRPFVHNLLDHARRPKEEREMEEQLMAVMIPFLNKARKAIMDHFNDPIVREEEMEKLRLTLKEQIRKLWPEKHRATVDGAIVCGSQIKSNGALLDFRAITQALTRNDDPLAATAASSHG